MKKYRKFNQIHTVSCVCADTQTGDGKVRKTNRLFWYCSVTIVHEHVVTLMLSICHVIINMVVLLPS